MYYLMKIFTLMDTYRIWVLGALFGALTLFALINWLRNPYVRQNKKLAACTLNIRSYPAKTALYMAALPNEYRRQWRAFVNCGTDKPALVFEFVPLKKRVTALWLLIVTSVATAAYIGVFALVRQNFVYIIIQAVFWLTFTLFMIIDRAISKKYTRRAKQIFAKFVSQLTACTPKSHETEIDDTVKALTKLNKAEVTDATVGKASEILQSKGLSENRTVEEQRRINLALNGLLQAYAKNAQHKPV